MTAETLERPDSERAESFWKRLDKMRAGMLGLGTGFRLVPMSHHVDRENGALWFIAADGSEVVNASMSGPRETQYVITSADQGLYANIQGTLSLVDDERKLEELWNAVAGAWFDGGPRDAEAKLLKFEPGRAEVWTTTTTSVVFAYEIAKAKVTDRKPDVGEHFTLTF